MDELWELWETYSASGRLSRLIATGTEAELRKIIDDNQEMLPYALGSYCLDTCAKIDEYLAQDYPEQ